jgi:hypothetical protein
VGALRYASELTDNPPPWNYGGFMEDAYAAVVVIP